MKHVAWWPLLLFILSAAPAKKLPEEVREPQEYEDWEEDPKKLPPPQEQQEEMFEQFTPKDEVDALNDTLDPRREEKNY